jgi:prepilin-type N-terminal cleavage/methylation domain-containing protein
MVLTSSSETRRRRQRGMSLVEVLIAMLIISVIAIGIVPLFARSARQNREGSNYTVMTNVVRSSLEEYLQIALDSPQLTLAPGTSEKLTNQYLDPLTKQWVTFVAPTEPPSTSLYQRSIAVQQFTAGDLLDDGSLDNPLDGAASKQDVHIKLVRVSVRPLWGRAGSGGGIFGLLGKRTPIAIELMKTV